MLKSRWVVPGRLEAAGYEFAFTDHESALADIVGAKRAKKSKQAAKASRTHARRAQPVRGTTVDKLPA